MRGNFGTSITENMYILTGICIINLKRKYEMLNIVVLYISIIFYQICEL